MNVRNGIPKKLTTTTIQISTIIWRSLRRYSNPPQRLAQRLSCLAGASTGYSIRVSAHRTARKLKAFRKKLPATPKIAIAYPPSDGPAIRDILNCAEFKARSEE